MKQAYLHELRRNIELEEMNRQLRQELIKATKNDVR